VWPVAFASWSSLRSTIGCVTAYPSLPYPALVNLFEADSVTNHCVEASTSFGSLIHETTGITGGAGGLRTNRSGWVA
jgi:hypothetical protein